MTSFLSSRRAAIIMFVLATISDDSLRVSPQAFGRDVECVLNEEIDAKYSGRVVMDVGLCLRTVRILERHEGFVYPLDGSATYRVVFQQLVFRPFVDEIVVATVTSSNADGLVASLDFFDDVAVPRNMLPQPSTYDEELRLWTWRWDEQTQLSIEPGLDVRIRVKSVCFTKVTAHATGLQATTTELANDKHTGRRRSSSVDLDSPAHIPSAMHVVGAINETGLGPVEWWTEDDDED